MHHRFHLTVLVAALASSACAKNSTGAATPTGGPQDFGVESAKIVFNVTGAEQGTVMAWIGDHGRTVVIFRDMAKPIEEKSHVIWKNGQSTAWSEGQTPHTTSSRNPATELRLVAARDGSELARAGFSKQANETVAGRECEVWRNAQTSVTLWRWQGVDLKVVPAAHGDARSTWEAVEVEVPAEVPADMIGPPHRHAPAS